MLLVKPKPTGFLKGGSNKHRKVCCKLQGGFKKHGRSAANCREVSRSTEGLLQIAGRFQHAREVRCKLQGGSNTHGKFAANCREGSKTHREPAANCRRVSTYIGKSAASLFVYISI